MGDWLVRRISVEGFQGHRSITAKFGRDPWFLIGRNGAGKTTLIELLNASLRLDYHSLVSSAFARIEVEFFDISTGGSPLITLDRPGSQGAPEDIIVGTVNEGAGAGTKSFILDQTSQFVFEVRARAARRARADSPANEISGQAARTLVRSHTDISWLSIHRGNFEAPDVDEDGDPVTISPIDSKLHSLANGITRYFSALDSRAAQATQMYQQNFFLSLLARSGHAPQPLSPEQVNDERKTLREIFLEFGMKEEVFATKLKSHFDAVERTSRALTSPKRDDRNIDMLSLFDTHRIHALIEQWRQLEAERTNVYSSKDKLRDMLNSLLYNKTVEYTE